MPKHDDDINDEKSRTHRHGKKKKIREKSKEKKRERKRRKHEKKTARENALNNTHREHQSRSSEAESSSCQTKHTERDRVGLEQLTSVREILKTMFELYPDGPSQIRGLFELLDSGERIVVNAIDDPIVRESVTLLLQLLRLPCDESNDECVFYTDQHSIDLLDTFADLLPQETDSKVTQIESPQKMSEVVAGPTMPTHAELAAAHEILDASDDDFVGPLPMAQSSTSLPLTNEQIRKRQEQRETDWNRVRGEQVAHDENLRDKREEWMTSLPTGRTGLASNAALSARTFTAKGLNEIGDTSQWTDNPEDKQRKHLVKLAQNEQERKRKRVLSKDTACSALKKTITNTATSSVSDGKETRGQSLLEQHCETLKRTKSLKPPSDAPEAYQGWDRDRDFASTTVDEKAFSNIVKQSKHLGSRFSNSTL